MFSADSQRQEMKQQTKKLTKLNEKLITDINQHHQALQESQRQLQESEERFQLAMQATVEGIWDWHIRQDTVYFSERWLEMLGFKEGDIAPQFSACDE